MYHSLKTSLLRLSLAAFCLSLPAWADSGNKLTTSPTSPVTAPENAEAKAVVGSEAPDFKTKDSNGKTVTLASLRKKYADKFIVLEWFNKDCPFVRKHYDSHNMQKLQEKYTALGVKWFQVLSSGKGKEGYQTGAQANAQAKTEDAHLTGILLDPSGKLGKLYGAKTTPDMYIIDPKGTLIYSGAIDSTKSANAEDIKTSKNWVDIALTEAMAKKQVSVASTTPYGCSVHYQ